MLLRFLLVMEISQRSRKKLLIIVHHWLILTRVGHQLQWWFSDSIGTFKSGRIHDNLRATVVVV